MVGQDIMNAKNLHTLPSKGQRGADAGKGAIALCLADQLGEKALARVANQQG